MSGDGTHVGERSDASDGDAPTILVVDNYDSFAYNLVQYVGEAVVDAGGDADDVVVARNDAIGVDDVRAMDPDGIVVSPGPGTPADSGVSLPIFAELSHPTLGVCLGHQALCAANGAAVDHAEAVVHGKSSPISHDGNGVFAGLPSPIEVGRYHSLAVDRDDLPDCLAETAWTVADGDGGERSRSGADREAGTRVAETPAGENPGAETPAGETPADAVAEDGVLMGVRHRDRPHVGVQFHPESILTDAGERLVANFCERCSTT